MEQECTNFLAEHPVTVQDDKDSGSAWGFSDAQAFPALVLAMLERDRATWKRKEVSLEACGGQVAECIAAFPFGFAVQAAGGQVCPGTFLHHQEQVLVAGGS